jgi:hypothetical protein
MAGGENLQTRTVHELRGVRAEILLYNDVPNEYGSRWGDTIRAACGLCQVQPGAARCSQVQLPAWGGDGV